MTNDKSISVDYKNLNDLKRCRPTGCKIKGESISTQGAWRDLLVRIAEKYISENHPKIGELYTKPLFDKGSRPFLLAEKPDGTCKQLYNGYWIYVDFKISMLVLIIYKLLFFVGIHESEIEITYAKTDEYIEPAYVPQKILHALSEDYKSGFRFDTTAIRLLSEAAGMDINMPIQDALKSMMFKREDDIYFLPHCIANENTRADIILFAESWLDEFDFFELPMLYELFSNQLNPIAISGLHDFETFYMFLNRQSIRCVNSYGTRLVRRSNSIEDLSKSIILTILTLIDTKFGGVVSMDILCEHFPAFSAATIQKIILHHCEDLVKTEINGIICYQTLDSLGLIDDFSSTLEDVLYELSVLGIIPSQENLHTALSIKCGKNIRREYNIPDDKTFRKLILTKTNMREWKGGVLVEAKQ